jgi:hypothetical protein
MHIQPVFMDPVTHAVNVLGIDLGKTIDDVKLVPAQSESSVFSKHPALKTEGFYRHCYHMKKESLEWFVAMGENMDFMAKIS